MALIMPVLSRAVQKISGLKR